MTAPPHLQPDGGGPVVDWKTGALPADEDFAALTVQLAAYRLAWASLSGTPLAQVRAAFHDMRQNHTINPVNLPYTQALRVLLRAVRTG